MTPLIVFESVKVFNVLKVHHKFQAATRPPKFAGPMAVNKKCRAKIMLSVWLNKSGDCKTGKYNKLRPRLLEARYLLGFRTETWLHLRWPKSRELLLFLLWLSAEKPLSFMLKGRKVIFEVNFKENHCKGTPHCASELHESRLLRVCLKSAKD